MGPHELTRANRERWALFPAAAAVGVTAGLVAVAFRSSLDLAEGLRTQAVERAREAGPAGLLGVLAGTAAAVAAAVLLVRRVAPAAAGSGIPYLKLILLDPTRPFRDVRVVLVKFVSGVLAIGAGLGLGREGPTVQMGAAVGSWLARRRRVDDDTRASLLICGSAAGLAAAFNAPLAGVVFALEELQVRLSHSAFFAAAVAALVADVVARSMLGELPVFRVTLLEHPGVSGLPYWAAVGVATGLVGVAFVRAVVAAAEVARGGGRRLLAAGIAVACAVAALGWFDPLAGGSGLRMTDALLDGDLAGTAVVAYLGLRFALTVGCYSLGAAGGIFAPMLLVGGLAGAAVGDAAAGLGLAGRPEPVVWAVAGMAGMFAAVVRAPLTGIVLLVEMTGVYELILPLMTAAFVGAGVADRLGVPPVYEWLADRAAATAPR